MAKVTQHSIEELKMRVSILDEIGRHVTLQKAGRSYKGLSPFTQEKTPSFFVDPQKGAFYCFSSNTGGDVIRFVELVEHLPFGEAVEALAQRYNVALEYENGGGPNKEDRSVRRQLLEIHEMAADFFHRMLMADGELSGKVREYWTEKRKFSMDVAAEFKIGFDPPGGEDLLKFLLTKGFSPQILMESGIFFGPEGYVDVKRMKSRFRGRLMIPIREPSQGQVIAFTARELFCTPGADTMKLGKYVNSPGTPLFHKSNVLFNLDRAQKSVRDDKGGFMMVEGQLDAIRSFTSGFTTTIAPQGTSVTDEQMHIMKRYSDHLRVVLDGDGAGQRAALRALPMAFTAGLEPMFVILPPKKDPDSLILEGGAEAMKALIDAALPPMRFFARALSAPEYDGPHGRAEAMKKADEVLSSVDSEVARMEYLKELCAILHVDFEAASADLYRYTLRQKRPQAAQSENVPAKAESPVQLTTLESDIWYIILGDGQYAKPLSGVVDDRWIDDGTVGGRLLGRLLWEIREGGCESVKDFISSLEDDAERNFVYALEIKSGQAQPENPLQDLNNLLDRLFIRYRKRRIEEINASLFNCGKDREATRGLLEERMQLMNSIKQLPCLPPLTR
jgi:DNA primase